VLTGLAADAAARVRRRVARSDGAGPALLGRLAEDSDVQVRAGIARHPAASAAIHRRLLDDLCPPVREALALGSRHEDVLLALAGSSADVLGKVDRPGDVLRSVRRAVS